MARTSYAIALGSNRRSRHGSPARTLRAALAGISGVQMVSTIRATPALGPAGRGFANAVAIVESRLEPDELLAELQKGGDFAAIAAQANSQLKTVALERGKPDPTTPQPILVQAFLLPHPVDGKPAWATVPMESGSYALVAVDKVTDGDTTKIPNDQRQALRGQMADAMGTGATMEFIEALKKKTKIQIAADRL